MLRNLATRRVAAALTAAALAGACNDGPAGPPPVVTVTVSPAAPATLTAIGETLTLSATAADASGVTVTGAGFTWLSDDPFVATVDAGVVTATGNGTATITVSAGGVDASVMVTVQQVAARVGFRAPSDATVRTVMSAVEVEIQDANGHLIETATDQVTVAIGSNPGNLVLHTSGIQDNDRIIELVDPAAPAVLTPELSNNEAVDEMLGLAYHDAAGTMYMTARTDTLFTVDLTSGVVTALGSTGDADRIKGIAYDTTNDRLLGAQRSADTLLAIDPATADTTSLGRITIAGDSIAGFNGLDYDPTTGTLYAVAKLGSAATAKDRTLVTLDVATLLATDPVALTEDGVAAITFLADGTLLAVTGDNATDAEMLWSVDRSTGIMRQVLALGNGADGESIEAIPARLSGTLTATAVDGVATFPDLVIDASGTGFTLVATASGLADGESPAFDVHQ